MNWSRDPVRDVACLSGFFRTAGLFISGFMIALVGFAQLPRQSDIAAGAARS